jgi:CrcB protein
VNVAGSGIGGVALGLALEGSLGSGWELIVLGGIAGGLTTFSTLAVDTVTLATAGDWWKAAVNVLGSFVLGVAAVCVGCALIAIL